MTVRRCSVCQLTAIGRDAAYDMVIKHIVSPGFCLYFLEWKRASVGCGL